MVCDDNLLLSKLLYLHGIYYNVIGQDPTMILYLIKLTYLNRSVKKNSLHLATMLGIAILSS
jgi:hypothetical protein